MISSRTLNLISLVLFLIVLISCTPGEEKVKATENIPSLTYDLIEEGISLTNARKRLTGAFVEHNLGSDPEIVVLMFENGNQLVFMDGILTDKNTAAELEKLRENEAVEE